MISAPDAPAMSDQHRDNRRADVDPRFVARVMELWDQKKNTAQMAAVLCSDRDEYAEARCCVALRVGREQRRPGE